MNRLRKLREAKKYTLDDIEKKTGINRGTYNNYESGKTNPKEPTWQALAKFFNVSVDYLKGYGYSKDYIYKLLDDMYKEDWINPIVFKDGIGERAFKLMKDSGERYDESIASSFFAKSTIQIYCENNKLKIPAELAHNFNNHDLSFWKNSFSFIFKNNGVNRLLTTKDKYTNDEIKELILSVIAQKNIGYTLKQALQKLSLNN